MIRPALVLSPAEARTVLARPRSPPGISATRAITRVFTSAENAAPALTWWSVLALSPLSLPGENRDGDEQQPDNRAGDGRAATEEVVIADQDHRTYLSWPRFRPTGHHS